MANKHKNEIRIQNVNNKVFEEINNIAKNQGITLAAFMKPELRKIVDSYPDKLKQPPLKY